MAKRSQREQFGDAALADLTKIERGIECQLGLEIVDPQVCGGILLESPAKLIHTAGFQGNSGGVAMAGILRPEP